MRNVHEAAIVQSDYLATSMHAVSDSLFVNHSQATVATKPQLLRKFATLMQLPCMGIEKSLRMRLRLA